MKKCLICGADGLRPQSKYCLECSRELQNRGNKYNALDRKILIDMMIREKND